MHDNQIVIPPSFIALFVPEGRTRPSEPWPVVAERYELCEDLAQMLTETARDKLFSLGVAESDVLDRMRDGLCGDGSPVSVPEAGWVVQRLAELLGWAMPVPAASPR